MDVASLSTISVLLVYGAMALYTVAFVAFAMDLVRRSDRLTAEAATGTAAAPAAVSRAGGGTAVLTAPPTTPIAAGAPPSRRARFATTVLIAGFGLHLLADVARGVAAGRVPWANMWEFSLTGTLVIVGVYLAVQARADIRFLGTFITGLVLVLLGIAVTRYYVAVVPLVPALQSYWLLLHVIVAILATGFFAIGFALSALHLLHRLRSRVAASGRAARALAVLDTLPARGHLDALAARTNVVGFILWTFTLIAGAIWAREAWGRYWGWDTKEVWTFIVWVLYAGYLHARATRGWSGDRAAWLAVIGFSAVMFNFGIVNVFFKGLHAYSGL